MRWVGIKDSHVCVHPHIANTRTQHANGRSIKTEPPVHYLTHTCTTHMEESISLRNRHQSNPSSNPLIQELNTPNNTNAQSTQSKELLHTIKYTTKITNKENKQIWKTIFQWRYYIIVLWICFLFPIGLFSQPKIMKITDSSYNVIKHTPSNAANDVYSKYYLPNDYESSVNPPILILLEQEDKIGVESMIDGTSDLYESTRQFMNNYARYMRDYSNDGSDETTWITVENYYDYEVLDLHSLGLESYVRNNGTYMLMVVNSVLKTGKDTYHFINDMKDYGTTFVPNELDLHFTGLTIFQQEMISSSIHDNLHIIAVVLPILLLITCTMLLQCNVMILLIPITMTAVSLTFWCIFIWPFMHYEYYQVSQITPTIVWCISIVISFEYSYILLSTIHSQMKEKQSLFYYVTISSESSVVREQQRYLSFMAMHGIILYSLNRISRAFIIISNLSLFLIFFGYLLLGPIDVLVNFGICTCVAIVGCIFASVSLIPSILFTKFGHYLILASLRREMQNPYCCLRKSNDGDVSSNSSNKIQLIEPLIPNEEEEEAPEHLFPMDKVEVMDRDVIDTTIQETLPIQPNKINEDDIEPLQDGIYSKLGTRLFSYDQRKPRLGCLLFLITLIFIAPSIFLLTRFKAGVNLKLTLPKDSKYFY